MKHTLLLERVQSCYNRTLPLPSRQIVVTLDHQSYKIHPVMNRFTKIVYHWLQSSFLENLNRITFRSSVVKSYLLHPHDDRMMGMIIKTTNLLQYISFGLDYCLTGWMSRSYIQRWSGSLSSTTGLLLFWALPLANNQDGSVWMWMVKSILIKL